jgi:hypothetical protein
MKIIVVKDKYFDEHILMCFRDFFSSLVKIKRKDCIIESIPVKKVKSDINIFKDADWVVTVFMDHNLYKKLRGNGTKVAVFWDDIHYWTEDSLKNRIKMFTNCDVLLLPYYKQFLKREEFKNFWEKAEYFPWYAPDICFKYYKKFNCRKEKYLLTGNASEPYSLRRKLYKIYKRDELIEILKHPGYDRKKRLHYIIHEKFYEYLSNYQVGFVTTADPPLNYTVAKYFEVPACGCALILQKTPDVVDLGFVEDEHYICINDSNYKDIKTIVKRHNLEQMSNNVLDLIKAKHTLHQRADLLFDIFKNRI